MVLIQLRRKSVLPLRRILPESKRFVKRLGMTLRFVWMRTRLGQQKEAVPGLIKRLNEYNLELVEQPVAYHDIAGLEYVTKHSDVPIMSDESCFNSKDALRLVERRAIDYLNIKLMKCGGIREALKINAICEAAGIEVMLGCMVEESNLGITAAASLGAATRNITRADLDATFNMTERPFKGGIYVENTKKLVLPDVPGFGFIGFDNE